MALPINMDDLISCHTSGRYRCVLRARNFVEARIAELVQSYLAKRLESEHLLNKAKTRVEQLIEEAAQR